MGVRAVTLLLEGRLSSVAVAADIDTNFKVFSVSCTYTGWLKNWAVGCS